MACGSLLAKPFVEGESEEKSSVSEKSSGSKSGDIWGDDDVALSYDHRDDLVPHDFPLVRFYKGCSCLTVTFLTLRVSKSKIENDQTSK